MDTGSLRHAVLVAGFVLIGVMPIQAGTRQGIRDLSPLQQRGAEVGTALLVEYYKELPEPKEGENAEQWAASLQSALEAFKTKVTGRYTEGTLLRLLDSCDNQARRAAVLALGLTGTMKSNKSVAGRLLDDDRMVRQLADDALWATWFRGDNEANGQELQRLRRLRDPQKSLNGLNQLIKKAPRFAEAYNQRAILFFRLEDFQKSIADCERVMKLNPFHFGAQAGMAQCYMKLKKPKAALKAFRAAMKINPNLDGVEETIRALEDALGEEGTKDSK
jgi:tetratricopeptide (TPR) repeat protein